MYSPAAEAPFILIRWVLHAAHCLSPLVIPAVAQRHAAVDVLVLLLRKWHSSAPSARGEQGIFAHSLNKLVETHSSFVVVRSWEHTAHILDPADDVAVHVDSHSRVAFLADEEVARRIWSFVVSHVHSVHACEDAWQPQGAE